MLVSLLASSAARFVDGAPLESNPVTPIDDCAPLDHYHPAFEAAINESRKIAPLVFSDANGVLALSLASEPVVNATGGDNGERTRLRRRLEASNRGIKRLENYFGESLETNYFVLKDEFACGSCPTSPWSSGYWPSFLDCINYAWKDGEPSPSEKYAVAFGKDVAQLQDVVSKSTDIQGQSKRKPCKDDSGCERLDDGSVCGIRSGESRGFCIPTWYGICHAWATAAAMEPEPRCDVEKDAVLFRPQDIKALMSQVYDGVQIETVFTGARCDAPDDPPLSTDKYGRLEDPMCRDLGAGYFYIAVAHIMGKHRKSFIVDVAAGTEVWNQSVCEFEVVRTELVDTEEASLETYGVHRYLFNSDAKYLAHTVLVLSWINESDEDGELVATGLIDKSTVSTTYTYFLEFDASYNIIGGEWLDDSRDDHPDFLWFTTEKPGLDTAVLDNISYRDVSELLRKSRECGSATPPPTPSRNLSPEPTAVPIDAIVISTSNRA